MNDKSKYNPTIHHRKSIRLKRYDYSQTGLYFITICCQDRICRFGKIENDKMILNEYGTIAYNEWIKLPERFMNFELDVFQIMPNHIHGIIVLNNVGASLADAQNINTPNTDEQNVDRAGFTPARSEIDNTNTETEIVSNKHQLQKQIGQPQGLPLQISDDDNRVRVNRDPTVGDMMGAYKSLVANGCLEIYKTKNVTMGKFWQRNFYEHIIRNEQSCQNISDYIINNPAKWKDDKFHK